ncbi:MAG: PH domain-containing protein [bacterium]
MSDGGAEAAQWSVPRWLPAAEGLLAAIFAATAVATGDRLATLMAAAAAVILAGFAARDFLVGVRVSADGTGVTVVEGLARRRTVPWAEVVAVGVGGRGRFGASANMLEIDTGYTVHLFSRREVGADLVAVAEALETLRSAALSR